jgi:hypothetical protein
LGEGNLDPKNGSPADSWSFTPNVQGPEVLNRDDSVSVHLRTELIEFEHYGLAIDEQGPLWGSFYEA